MTERSWYLTLGLNPYEALPSAAEAGAVFGKYRNTVGKMSTKSSADADELKELAALLDKVRDKVIAEVQTEKAQLDAKIALMGAAKDSVNLMKLQSNEFDAAMIDLVLRETKSNLKDYMYPKGKNNLTEDTIKRVILAHGGSLAGEGTEEAIAEYEALAIDEVFKSKFRSIDTSLGKLVVNDKTFSDLYELMAMSDDEIAAKLRKAESAYLLDYAKLFEEELPSRGGNSKQVICVNLMKSAQEIFANEEMRVAYDKHITLSTVSRVLGSVKAMGSGGKVASRDYSIVHAKKLAEELGDPRRAAKLFIGFMAANGIAADVTYSQLLDALGVRQPAPQPQYTPQPQAQFTPQQPVAQAQPGFAPPQQQTMNPVGGAPQVAAASPMPYTPFAQGQKKTMGFKKFLLYGVMVYAGLMALSVISQILYALW